MILDDVLVRHCHLGLTLGMDLVSNKNKVLDQPGLGRWTSWCGCTDHEQYSILQWPSGLNGLLVVFVAVLPGSTFLNHHSGFWLLLLIVKEEVICLLVL